MLLNQQNHNDSTHILRRSLNNLIKFKKFENLQNFILVSILYYTYYLNEKFCNQGFDHSQEKYSQESKIYYRILLNQLSSILEEVQKAEKNEMIKFNIFFKFGVLDGFEFVTQKQCLKKQIIEINKKSNLNQYKIWIMILQILLNKQQNQNNNREVLPHQKQKISLARKFLNYWSSLRHNTSKQWTMRNNQKC
ncbi:unnamed protein product [Paramecium octaurelia]|uniref:Uncharacterized protein n=1 Tax=Paramecium octaurelia TaxID=43137 RepID=A0A8S1TFQ5_PAROT|nr:unnamed protein product [Paramecium octaurelia]